MIFLSFLVRLTALIFLSGLWGWLTGSQPLWVTIGGGLVIGFLFQTFIGLFPSYKSNGKFGY